jgi:xylulokinase
MFAEFLAGVDIGVSFIKVGIYDPEGNCKANITKINPGKYPAPDVFIQSSEEMLKIVITSLKEAVELSKVESSSVKAIGFSGAMGGFMGVNEKWEPVAEWSIVSDTRYNKYSAKMIARAEEKIIELSGSSSAVFGPKILWWKNDFPQIYSQIKKFMGLCGFIIGRMAKTSIDDASIDKTITVFSGIADIKNSMWSDELCQEFGIDIDMLPKIVNSDTIVGYLSKDIAGVCGLREGIPLVAGSGDKAAGNLGAGLVTPGLLIDEAATYGAFSVCTDRYVPDIKNRTLVNLPSPVEGLFTPGAYLTVSGATSAWFTEIFAGEEKKEASRENIPVFKLLDRNAANIPPGSEGLFSISMLAGRSSPSDPDIKGLYMGHTLMHKKEHFYRAMLESFAYEYAFYFNVMKKNYPELAYNEVLVMGGGAKSDFYNQIKCDVLGIPYSRLSREDFALLGDILIAGKAVGIYKDLKEAAKKFVVKTKKFIPDENNHNIYKKYVQFHAGIFDRVRDIFIDLKKIGIN